MEDDEKRTFYMGNYGYPPFVEPPEIPVNICEWLDETLTLKVKSSNHMQWAVNRLRIIVDMLRDREQEFFADDLESIKNVLERDLSEEAKINGEFYERERSRDIL